MGFGFLVMGYLSVLGVLPYFFVYFYGWSVYIAVAGGLIMLAGFCRLEEYGVYFKIMKYICIGYILMLLGFSPFLIINHSKETEELFIVVSKIIRICFMFAFHFFLLSGILSLAREVENVKIEKKAKINIYFTYVFFSMFIFEFFNIPSFSQLMIIVTILYCISVISVLYSCYMRITYEGHDEEIEKKYNLMQKNKNKNNRKNKG
jgi:hypothetical protein